MTSYIGILSAKGGVGKSTTAINLSAAVNDFGRNSVLFDGNYTKPNIGIMLNMTKVDKTLHHALRGEVHTHDTVYLHESGLQVVPGSIVYEELFSHHVQKLKDMLLTLQGKTEMVFVDCGPGFGPEVYDVIRAIDKAILVTTSDLSSITDTLRIKKLCKDNGIEILGVVVTKTTQSHAADMQVIFEEPVIAEIPFDIVEREPRVFTKPDAPSSKAYKKLAANLLGTTWSDEDEEGIISGILKRLGFK